MLDGSSDPIFTFDSDYRYMYANQAFAEGIGKDLKDVIGKTLWDVFSEEEAAKRMALVKWVFDNKKSKTHEIWVSRGSADHYYLTTLRPIVAERVNDFATPCFMNLLCKVVLLESASFAASVG